MEQLHKLALRELAAGVNAKRWSAAEVVRAHAARIIELEPRVKAWVQFDLDRAMGRAEAADGARTRGTMSGVPVAVKDIIDVAGMPTRCGSPIYEHATAVAESAACVQLLERAGAIVVGKSVTTEFAYYTPRKTRNPWNPAHTPGGSSMGSAAAVACGMVAGALGTQTNGSVIRPAAFCGIVGYKPTLGTISNHGTTLGTISNHGTLDPWPTLDHTGVFARNVADAAALAAVISDGVIGGSIARAARAPRLALVRSPVWRLAEDAQKAMLASNGASLAAAGARVEELDLPADFDDAHRVHRLILAYEGARYFGELQQRHRGDMSARFNELLDEGGGVAETAYRDALRMMARLRSDFARAVSGVDAIITPPAAGEAPPTLSETGNPAFCTIWTLLGVPAITIPVALGPAGLPLGLQVVGIAGSDDATLAVAAWCEANLPFAGLVS
jgi:Asp-tRNA(Asn)/Glu-tRNA(Gln) amidotransferase A subunit family amidase